MAEDHSGGQAGLDLRVLAALERTVQAIERPLFAHIRSGNLTPAQFDVLEALYHGGPLTVNGVIQRTLGSSGNIGVVVDNLIKSGLVTKRVDQDDRRVRYLELSEAGSQLMTEFFPCHLQVVEATFTGLDKHDKRALIDLLRKLRKSVS